MYCYHSPKIHLLGHSFKNIYLVFPCARYYTRCWENSDQPNSDDSCPHGTYSSTGIIDIFKRYTSQQISTNCGKKKGKKFRKLFE